MMDKLKKMLPYLLINVLAFYGFPLLIRDTGSAMFFLLGVIPLTCLVVSLIYGIKHSFNWPYGWLVTLLFIPTIFIFYNESAAIYILMYGGISFVGNRIGAVFHK